MTGELVRMDAGSASCYVDLCRQVIPGSSYAAPE